MINTFLYLQKDKLNITKIRKLLFFAIILILQNTINSKLSRSYAYDVTCRYMGTMCNPSEPICASDDYCTHYRYAGGAGRCDNGQNRWNYWICPGNCDGVLPPTCEPSGGGGGYTPPTELTCNGCPARCANGGSCTEAEIQCAPAGAWPCYGDGPTCVPISCNECDPNDSSIKGSWDTATCDSECKITVTGWACDSNNYTIPLAVNIRANGAYVKSTVANIFAEAAVGSQCDGNRYHRFNFSTNSLSPITTYDVAVLAFGVGSDGNQDGGADALKNDVTWNGCSHDVSCGNCTPDILGCTSDADCNDNLFCTDDVCDIPTGVCSNPVKTCNDSNTCTTDSCDEVNDRCNNVNVPTNGSLGPWGFCSGGYQISPCNDFSCGGSCSAECTTEGGTYNSSTNICTRDCLRVDGGIGGDYNNNGNLDLTEKWSGKSLSCNNTGLFYEQFNMGITGESGNQISDWFCHSNPVYGVYYNTPDPNSIEPESEKIFTLSSSNLPVGHSCGTWKYEYGGAVRDQGNGCVTDPLTMPVSGYVNVNWILGCTVNQGTLSDWSNCSNGKQTRTCTGTTCCGGVCGNCDGAILERDCLRIDSNIWSDDDKNGISISDYWKKDSTSPSGCSTNKTFSDFVMTISGETTPSLNQISDWWCHPSGYGVYFNTPVPNAIEPESTKTASLTNIPAGYDVLSWRYRYLKDGIITSQTGLGGVTSNLLMPPYANWVNLHWELEQQTYNLTINVKKIKPEITDLPGSCGDSDIYDGPLSDASITVRDRDDNTVVCSGSSNSGGDLVCPVWILQGPLNIEATKTVGGATPETYELRCPNSTVYEYDPGSVNDGDNKSVGIGLKVNYKDGWVSAIDSDIFANIINVVVPEGPTDNSDTNQTPQGFAKTLINSSVNDEKHLGFIFSEVNDRSNPNVDTECPDSKGFETTDHQCTNLGGFSYNLISGGEHDSKWLKNFTFTPPSGAIQLSSIGNSFKANTVYKIAQDDYSTIELPGTYSITDGTGVSILYFEGNLVIRENFTTNSNGRLLLIVNGAVTITKDVGIDLSTLPANSTDFVMSENPHIMAGIIASGNIYFQSVGGSIKDNNRDKAIMVSAPLISKTSISFGRDLYHDNNATMPAESAKSFNKYLYLLTSLEREKSQENLYFTGLTTYDLDWEYIY